MNRIVFVLSENASARIRAYCEEHGSDLDGLASDAVSCLLDVLSDDYGGPWTPSPCGLATGHDLHSASIATGSPIWETAQDEADAVCTMLDLRAQGMTLSAIVAELRRAATEGAIRECVRELRAAGMSVRAIADELARLGGRRIPAKKSIK